MKSIRHRKDVYNPALAEKWRARIQVSAMLDVLNKVSTGEIKASTAQMKAIEIGLRKTIPDLQSVQFTGDANVRFTWAPPDSEPVTIDMPTGGGKTDSDAPDDGTPDDVSR